MYNIESKRCKKCIMPEVLGHIELNSNGICNLCEQYDEIQKEQYSFSEIAAQEKLNILKKKVDRYKNKSGYDCVVAVSGGKDSIMTLYIAVVELGLKPLAVMIDNGFMLDEMYENAKNATDILGVDLVIYKTSMLIKMFKIFLESKKKIYYCRVCHALMDMAVLSICKNHNISLVLGGYTKGQQYIKLSELYWIYEQSDKNTIELLKEIPEFQYLIPMYKDQKEFFNNEYGMIRKLSPFKYIQWNEDEIIKIITDKLKWKMPKRSWPNKSSNCTFNYVSQYLAQKQFGYAQHESELSSLIRENEISRMRAEEIINSPIEDEDLIKPLNKLGLSIDDIK